MIHSLRHTLYFLKAKPQKNYLALEPLLESNPPWIGDRKRMALTPVRLFFSYSHKDEAFKGDLEAHLKILQRRGLIDTWSDRQIIPGQDWESAIQKELDHADIILFLVSAQFIASDYCYGKELSRAMERHERNEAKVIPVIVRPVDWNDAPFSMLQALPKDRKPVTLWTNQDEAWLDVEEGIKKAVEELQETKFRATSTSALTSVRELLVEELKNIANLYDDRTSGIAADEIPTGIHDLDLVLGGLRSSELIVIAGRPAIGKSDFLVNISKTTAIGLNRPVAFFSLQMPAKRVIQRLVASTSGIDSVKLRRAYLGEKDLPKLATATAKLVEAPIYIDDTPRLTIPEIRTRANRLKLEKEIRLLIIDSLQQIILHDIAQSVVALKTVARELQIPVLVTSNISQKADRRRDKRPIFPDLDDWGSLQQEADVILFLYRNALYYPNSEHNHNELDIIVAKNRSGPTDYLKAWYDPASSQISNLSENEEDYYKERR
jgi:replicative DNA helicase